MTDQLLIGCGAKRINLLTGEEFSSKLTTLDINPDHRPDVEWDLTNIPLPFSDESFDEIHAYQVLEHTGAQGDFRFFFAQFSDFWRILRPTGLVIASVPALGSRWVWGDPSHSRVISLETLTFLIQPQYTEQVGKTDMSDFRYVYAADFDYCEVKPQVPGEFRFVLRAVKPSRITRS